MHILLVGCFSGSTQIINARYDLLGGTQRINNRDGRCCVLHVRTLAIIQREGR